MTSPRDDAANNIPPPRKAVVLATVTSVATFIVPKELCGGWIEIHNDDASAKIGLNFGATSADAALMTTLTAVSTVTSSLPDMPATVPGIVLGPGAREHVNLADFDYGPNGMNSAANIWCGHLSSATGGYLRIRPASGPAKG